MYCSGFSLKFLRLLYLYPGVSEVSYFRELHYDKGLFSLPNDQIDFSL